MNNIGKKATRVTFEGAAYDFSEMTQRQLDDIAGNMDDELREDVHSEVAPCLPGEFVVAYLRGGRGRGHVSEFAGEYLRDFEV